MAGVVLGALVSIALTGALAFTAAPAIAQVGAVGATLVGQAVMPDGTPASGASGLLSALDAAGDDHPITTVEADPSGRFTAVIPNDPALFAYAAQTDGALRLVIDLTRSVDGVDGGVHAAGVYRALGAAEAKVERSADVSGGRDVFVSPAPAQYVLDRLDSVSDDPPGSEIQLVRGEVASRKVTVCRTYAWRANCPVNKYGAYGWQTMVIQDVIEQMYHWDPNCYVPPGTIDGYFGGATKFAVEFYQMCHGLEDDGIVGFQTWGYFWNQPERKGLQHRIKRADGSGYCWNQNGSQVCIKDNHCVPSNGGVDNFVDVNPYNTFIFGWQQHRVPSQSNAHDDRWTVLDNRNGRVGKCHYMTDDFR